MRTHGEYIRATRTLEGDICISFAIDDDYKVLEQLEKLEGKELTIEAKKYSKKRSLNANAYFWKLCDQMARRLESNKEGHYISSSA